MNFHALAPKRYKRSVVSGFVHRIHRSCSNWPNFHTSLEKSKQILENNQYPPAFYNPIIEETITGLIENRPGSKSKEMNRNEDPKESIKKKLVFVQYRGKVTEDFARALHRIKAPVTLVMTLRKLKTTLPSLKPQVRKELKSWVVYKITCPCCQASYVGQTCRHLSTRYSEHFYPKKTMSKHIKECPNKPVNMSFENDCTILDTCKRNNQNHLLTLEALWIDDLKPTLNTKDEYRSRTLTIKL